MEHDVKTGLYWLQAALNQPLKPPRELGEKVVSLLDDPKYAEGFAFGLKGDTGVTMLEGAAA